MTGAPLLDVHIHGTPRPKGSMRHVGNGRMVEQLKHSPAWRTAVVDAARAAVGCQCPDPECAALKEGYPFTGAADVRLMLLFAKPKSAPKTKEIKPTTRSTGDADKHARNILDALVDAGVLRDDSQVVRLDVTKRYCGDSEAPGARVCVWEAT